MTEAELRRDLLLRCVGYLRFKLNDQKRGILEPFDIDATDPLAVNSAVNRIAFHAGLRGLYFLVAIARMQPREGGRIELQEGQREVMIDISTDAGAFTPSLLAVLAHEVTHKVLFDNRILPYGNGDLGYEVLTDVAAIWLGFGKLMLNGYKYERDSRGVSGRARLIRQFGYLSVEEVAFVHRLASSIHLFRLTKEHDGLLPSASSVMTAVGSDARVREAFRNAAAIAPRHSYR